MGAQNYLLANKQKLVTSSFIAGVLLFVITAYAVTNAESAQNQTINITSKTGHESSSQDLSNEAQLSANNLDQTSVAPSGEAGEVYESEVAGGVVPIKPITPLEPIQPNVPSVGNSNGNVQNNNVGIDDHNEDAAADPKEAETESNVRIRMRDRSSSEINGSDVESNSSSLNITIREETSAR